MDMLITIPYPIYIPEYLVSKYKNDQGVLGHWSVNYAGPISLINTVYHSLA